MTATPRSGTARPGQGDPAGPAAAGEPEPAEGPEPSEEPERTGEHGGAETDEPRGPADRAAPQTPSAGRTASAPQTTSAPHTASEPSTASATRSSPARPTPSETTLAIRTEGLTKRFRSGQIAVDDVDLQVPQGAVYGFLGPNGSGKTTTIRMLLGLIRPTSGQVHLLDEPMPEAGRGVLPRVGALIEGPAFQPYLSGRANLTRLDAVDATADPRTRKRRTDAALERVGLAGFAGRPYRQYSLGMKQRLGLAAALLRPRELLVLDEPTNGLDPQGTREVRRLIGELAEAGTTVLVSSHLLAEIEHICSHVGIMSHGRLVLQGERDGLTGEATGRLTVTTTADYVATAAAVLTGLGLDPDVEGTALTVPAGGAPAEEIAAALVHAGVALLGLGVHRPTLEDVFVDLTGEGFDVDR